MARLPEPGGDAGKWGDILNTFLQASHNDDGTLKDNAVTQSSLAPDAVQADNLAAPGGADGQVLVKDSGSATGFSWQSSGSGVVPDASTTVKGVVMLAGDLAGTATAPTVPGLANKANTSHTHAASDIASGTIAAARLGSGTASSSTYLRGDGTWTTPPAGGVTSVNTHTGAVVLSKSDIGLANVDNTSDASKPVSSATQTALNAKANDSATVHMTGNETVAGVKTFSSSPVVPTPTAGGQAANKTYVDNQIASGIAPDATTSSKGIVQLTGDLAGTATDPVVAKVNGVTVSGTPSAGQVLKATSATAATWQADATGGGGGSMNVISRSANYTAQADDYILLDMSAGAVTITTPAPANGAVFSVKKVDASANNVTVVPSSGNIDGYLVNFSFPTTDRGISQDFLSNGTNWYLV